MSIGKTRMMLAHIPSPDRFLVGQRIIASRRLGLPLPYWLAVAFCGFSLACDSPAGRASDAPQTTAAAGVSANPKNLDAQVAPNSNAATPGSAVDGGTAISEHYLGATNLQAPILSEMEWPSKDKKSGSVRLGYLRQGGKAAVIAEAHAKANCNEGWYELVAGGFVCGKYATIDLNHPRFRTSPHAPYMDRPLPYDYGYNVAHGTPLYRSVPSREDRAENEPWLAQARRRKLEEHKADDTQEEEDAGASTATTGSSSASGTDPDAGAVPWYLRDHDGGKPQITLDDLRGDGVVSRRMVKGFFLGLDKSFSSGGARWWRTTETLVAPAERIAVWKMPTEFHGIWLDERGDGPTATPQAHKSPGSVGFILNGRAKKYTMNPDRKHVSTGGDTTRFSAFRLTGETAVVASQGYSETEEGWWMRDGDSARTHPGAPPQELKLGEKWVDVNITQQTLTAFEGDKPVYATLISSGRTSPIKDKDHPTPTGTWRIREKHVAATMDGDVASDGPYSIEDVPWIMYFQGSYALHGAFWHANFGRKQSHGCVNLSPIDAKAIFGWTEPSLPDGWHGVVATGERPGSWVVVHE
jgi:hypothetical protein